MIKLCDYGCGQEAKFYFPTVKKWCCSEHYSQCPVKRRENSIRIKKLRGDPDSIYNSDSYREKQSKALREAHKDPNSGYNSDSHREKQSKALREAHKDPNNMFNKLTIKQIKELHPFFLEIEDLRYNPDKPEEKEIQVHCINHNCPNSKEKGGWFTPTPGQFKGRKDCLKIGEDKSNFYCSQHCKDTCPSYRSHGADPFRNTKSPYTYQEQQTWRSKVLIREEYICEWCGGPAIEAHHVLPVKTHPHLALDPDNGVACCKKCHYKYGHKTGTECSTKTLADKVLLGCKLGGQE